MSIIVPSSRTRIGAWVNIPAPVLVLPPRMAIIVYYSQSTASSIISNRRISPRYSDTTVGLFYDIVLILGTRLYPMRDFCSDLN